MKLAQENALQIQVQQGIPNNIRDQQLAQSAVVLVTFWSSGTLIYFGHYSTMPVLKNVALETVTRCPPFSFSIKAVDGSVKSMTSAFHIHLVTPLLNFVTRKFFVAEKMKEWPVHMRGKIERREGPRILCSLEETSNTNLYK